MEEYRSAELQREFEQARNFEWFVANYALFQRTYGDSVLVIENCRIVGVYNDYATAVHESNKIMQPGFFSVQEVSTQKKAYEICIPSCSVV